MFVKECDAVVCLPGGFGTLDEGLEVLTLLQTGKREMVPVIFLDEPRGTFWRDWNAFVESRLKGDQLISPDDLSLYRVTDSVPKAVDEILDFYRVYHSQRFVRDRLVFRLKERLHASLVTDFNRHFADILAEGEFQQREALDDERDEPDMDDLPRLVFHFNRRSLGRLRQLIDAINRGSVAA